MRLKSFTAGTMDEAMRQVREALGPDAVIVSSYEGRRGRGVVITAAREDVDSDRAVADSAVQESTDADSLAKALAYHGIPGALSA